MISKLQLASLLAIYNSIPKIRNSVKIDHHPPERDSQKTSFLFRWSLAACLHDIAYPLELTLKSFKKGTSVYNAMAARGYDGQLPIISYKSKNSFTMLYCVIIAGSTLIPWLLLGL